jgi:addiction module RelE/StbE family toxin
MQYKVKFLDEAENDILKIAYYISNELYNPTAATKLIKKMRQLANGLKEMPKRHPVYETYAPLKQEFRKIVVGSYIMFYFINDEKKKVYIVFVMNEKQDFDTILATF